MEAVVNMNQMSLPTFCKSFDMPRETVLELIRGNKKFPGYKIGGRWYIDISYGERKTIIGTGRQEDANHKLHNNCNFNNCNSG